MGKNKSQNSRKLAATWKYPRHSYFQKQLRVAAASWFQANGFEQHVKYPYCLKSLNDWPKNIIDQRVVDYIKEVRDNRKGGKGFSLHKYVHHGLSSQALLFNLVGPLIVSGDLGPLRQVLEGKGVTWPEDSILADFEYEDREIFNEDSGQPTSIDLIVQDSTGKPNIFIESKLVEKEFGGCSVFAGGNCDGRNPAANFDQCYLHHIGRRYWGLLETHGFLDGPLRQERTCILASHYQFFREVLFAIEQGGTFVLLSDERSPVFHCVSNDGTTPRGLMEFLCRLVPERVLQKIKSITIQEVVQSIEISGRHPWIEEFKIKYAL